MVSLREIFCTIVETQHFADCAKGIFSPEEIDGLFDYLSTHPQAGAVIQGGGGIRKLRWGRAGQGKSGGGRVIYFHRQRNMTIVMLSAYAKGRKSDLSAAEKAAIRKMVEELERHEAGQSAQRRR